MWYNHCIAQGARQARRKKESVFIGVSIERKFCGSLGNAIPNESHRLQDGLL